MKMYPVALSIFCAFFALVTVAGFMAARWRRPDAGMHSLEEWGLAGRSFGTFITWFLLGGDVYTAYTVIAVPAAMFGVGAMGFFAVPYTILIYPYMMVVLPKLWTICHRHNYVTFADLVRGRFGFRPLTIAIAITGILALMPYIALQLVGMKVALAAMGLKGEWPLILAFMILALYTYSAGLRAPAMIAVIKDVMLYVMVIAAVVILPAKVGGFAHVFAVAKAALPLHSPAGSLLLRPGQLLPYSTLAIGSTLALILYPHTATAVLSSSGPNTLRRNAALLPVYSLLLGMLALLGYVAIAAGINSPDKSATIPLLFLKMFPEWFAGFCLAAIAIGALVPAAIMSIAAANLFTRNLWGELARTPLTVEKEAAQAKIVSMVVKVGALAFVLETPGSYAIEMQLLGGIWITQLFPAVICGAFMKRRLHPWAVFAGWAGGMAVGSGMAIALEFKGSGVYPLHAFGQTWSMYAAVPALALNLLITFALSPVFERIRPSIVLARTADEPLSLPVY
jgi:SSS family solute:Na+ symporter